MGAGLSKEERLSGRNAISDLMKKGKYGNESFLRYCYVRGTGLDVNRILVSVPKRNFKRAVKRNLLKRRLRESYRLQKELLGGPGVDIMFVYTAREVLPSEEIRAAVRRVLLAVAAANPAVRQADASEEGAAE